MLVDKVREIIEKYNLISKNDKVIVALSGGPDSMCLLDILNKLKNEYDLSLHCLYLNHMIREDAIKDEELVRDFCDRMGVSISIYKKDIPKMSQKLGLSLEECGRIVRYKVLKREMKLKGFSKIATAHHLDDNIETFLMRQFKGTSLGGLKVIKPKNGHIIRPLIGCTKGEILSYIQLRGIPFVIDKTNYETTYERNYIRNVILPEVEKKFPSYRRHLGNLIEDIWQLESVVEKLAKNLTNKALVELSSHKVIVDIDKLVKVGNEFLIKESIKNLFKFFNYTPTRKQISIVYEGIKCRRGNKELLKTSRLKVVREYDRLLIHKLLDASLIQPVRLVEIKGIKIKIRVGDVKIDVRENNMRKVGKLRQKFLNTLLRALMRVIKPHKRGTEFITKILLGENFSLLDEDILREVLKYESLKNRYYIDLTNIGSIEVRNKREGDFMYVKGGRKKIKDIMIDEKIPLTRREGAIVFDIGNGEICLLKVGNKVRVSEKFFLNRNTKKFMVIEFLHLQ